MPKQLARLLVRPLEALSAVDAVAARWAGQDQDAAGTRFAGVPSGGSPAAMAASLARRFRALVRRCGTSRPTRPAAPVTELDAWLADAKASGVAAAETFATGLEQDGVALRAVLAETWSSGQAGGQINRLKLLKRQSYGRASFDLLRRRVLMAA